MTADEIAADRDADVAIYNEPAGSTASKRPTSALPEKQLLTVRSNVLI